MQTWQIEGQPAAVPWQDVATLVESAASPHPAQAWLRLLSRAARIDYLCVVEYAFETEENLAAPRLLEGWAAPGVANVTAECFALYRQRYWRCDEATRLAQFARDFSSMTALHCHSSDIQEPWRREVYDPADLEARLSLLYLPAPGTTAAINLYRRRSLGIFQPAEIARLIEAAPLVQLAHRELSAYRQRAGAATGPAAVEHALRRILLRLPELSDREAAVCARIARGISLDGIAEDLGIAPSSVATMRKRAYAKLARRGVPPGREQLARLAE